MTNFNENNNIIAITEEQIAQLREFRQDAYGFLADADTAKANLKQLVEDAADATGVDKKDVAKFFTLGYKAKTGDYLAQAAVIEALNKA